MSNDFAKSGLEFKSAICKTSFLVVLCFVLACFVWLLDRFCLRVELTAYIFSYGFFANALPFILVLLLLMVLVNRVTVAIMVTGLLTMAIYFADHQSLKFLSVPLSFNDAFLLADMDASTFHLLSHYVNRWYLLAALLFLAAWFSLSILRERAFFRKRSVVRLLLGAVVLFFSVTLVTGGKLASDIYGQGKIRLVPWAPMLTILHSGLLSSIEYWNVAYRQAMVEPVDRQAIKAFVDMPTPGADGSAGATPLAAADQRPDIVIIQSESFFDPAILKDVDNTDAELPNLHRALQHATGGTMKAPTFGGGTLRTEFEVLTGVPMRAYPKIDFPYLQIRQEHIPSLVDAVHSNGYKAYAVHPNNGSFWNRDKAFKEMGFDRFLTRTDFPENAKSDGWFLSDEAMTDEIIGLLDKSSSPSFVFAISIEGHGPYEHVPVGDMAKRDAIPVPAGWPAQAVNEYRNYMYHIGNADQQMGRLWAYLESRHRPYVLAFYGDHLPGLQYVYALHGFDDQSEGQYEFVPWFVLAGGHPAPKQKHIYAWMLGGEVLDAARLNKPPYYQAVGKAEQILMENSDAAQINTVMHGINFMSRLYLTGKFDQEMPSIEAQGRSK
jgi:Sulfatase